MADVTIEPSAGAGGEAGVPVALSASGGPAAEVFHAIAQRIIDEIAPPVNMAGCSARMLAAVAAAFDKV